MAIGTTIDGLNAVTSLTAQDEVPVWDSEERGEPTKKITASNLAASVKSLASLPNTTEMNTAIAQSTAISNVAITMESGFTSSLFARKAGNVVCINGYVTASSAFTSSETKIGNVAAGARPGDIIRMPVPISGAAYNPPTGTGIMFISANGNINVVAPASNTNKVIYFSVAYIAQN